jgi:hypothetical protein
MGCLVRQVNCAGEGCTREARAKGLCDRCYLKEWRKVRAAKGEVPKRQETRTCECCAGRSDIHLSPQGLVLCARCRSIAKKRGQPIAKGERIPRTMQRFPANEPCFQCSKAAVRRGRHVYLCEYHYQRECDGRSSPFGTDEDTPPGFRHAAVDSPEIEAEDEAKIDRILTERRAQFDDREEPRALDPWFQRDSPWNDV